MCLPLIVALHSTVDSRQSQGEAREMEPLPYGGDGLGGGSKSKQK